jgi:hypothetical protein
MSEHLQLDTRTGRVRGTSSNTGTEPKPIDFSSVFVIGLRGGSAGSGSVQLVAGQAYIDVVFTIVQPDTEWVLTGCSVENTTDPNPLNIWPGIITDKTTGGFRLELNGAPDSSNYFLHWTIRGTAVEPTPATTYFLTGPATGSVGAASTPFTVQLPPSATVPAPVTVTPHDGGAGGTFTPTSKVLTTTSPSATFTYTPASYGAKTISTTNNGGLTDPASVTFTCLAPTYSLTGPSTGDVGTPSTNFTVTLSGAVVGTVNVTPSAGGGGGTFTPASVALTTGAPSATFTYTPASAGAKTISVTNDGGLANPTSLTYTAVAPLHLLNTLISYWKLDEATLGTVFNDSKGTNHLTMVGGTISSFASIINGGAYFSGTTYASIASNASLQTTGDFTFSLWVRVDTAGAAQFILTKDDGSTNRDYAIAYFGGSSGFGFFVGSPAFGVTVGTPVPLFVFHHIVAWYDSSDQKVRMRIDDATTYVSSSTGAHTASTIGFVIGAVAGGTSNFTGLVDEVGFWKRKLTAAEITALYNGGAGLPFSSFTA